MRLLRHLLRQLRHHAPRMHRKTQHPLRRVLHHDMLGELEHGKLGRLIRAAAGTQRQRAQGAHVDNRLEARRIIRPEQQRQERLSHPVEAAVVDLPRAPVVIRVGLGDREARFHIARIVDEDVQPAAEGMLGFLRGSLDARVVEQVEGDGEDLGRGVAVGGCGRREHLLLDGVEVGAGGNGYAGGAGAGIGEGGGATDAEGGAADEDGFAGEVGLCEGGDGGIGVGVDGGGELYAWSGLVSCGTNRQREGGRLKVK